MQVPTHTRMHPAHPATRSRPTPHTRSQGSQTLPHSTTQTPPGHAGAPRRPASACQPPPPHTRRVAEPHLMGMQTPLPSQRSPPMTAIHRCGVPGPCHSQNDPAARKQAPITPATGQSSGVNQQRHAYRVWPPHSSGAGASRQPAAC